MHLKRNLDTRANEKRAENNKENCNSYFIEKIKGKIYSIKQILKTNIKGMYPKYLCVFVSGFSMPIPVISQYYKINIYINQTFEQSNQYLTCQSQL